VFGIIQVADGQVGHGAAAVNALVLFPKAPPSLQEDLGGGVVVQLADGALFGAEKAGDTSMWRMTEKGRVRMA
jgi:hypothetical protein